MQPSENTLLSYSLITPDHLRKKALIYLRQSTMEQVERNTGSTQFQRNQVDLAHSYGWPDHLIEVLDEDLGKSGSSTQGRTGWQKMLDQIAANQIGAVFAANVSRLARQLIDFETLRILAAYHQTLIITDGRVIDPKDSNDTVLTQVTATIAQFENRKRAEVMRQARFTKARQGIVVSPIPVGWVLGADGKYEYDPAVKDIIDLVIATFWKVKTLRGTVLALEKTGVKIPSKMGNRILWSRPTLLNVSSILKNPAYSGTYIYGRTKCSPELGVHRNGDAVRVDMPEHQWVKVYNKFPPYLTIEAQEQIKAILKAHDFRKRYRPGRGSGLCQGLLYCASCGVRLLVQYHSKEGYAYYCGWKTIQYGQKPCTYFDGKDFDRAVEQAVLSLLCTPPVELLKEAHAESLKQFEARRAWIKNERERLEHERDQALDALNRSRFERPRVYAFVQEKLEKILETLQAFERNAAAELGTLSAVPSDKEFEELCAMAANVPNLWYHPLVTQQERKELVRCVIEKITATATKDRIQGTVVWKSGYETSIKVWRHIGRYNLIRDLHNQGFSLPEVAQRLERGENSTGQCWKLNKLSLYLIFKKLGLKPNRRPKWYESLQEEAARLNEKGYSMRWIADEFNRRGLKSLWGKPWTKKLVFSLISKVPRKPYSLQKLHREVIAEARRRGLGYAKMAREFNERGVPRRDSRPWTAKAISERWYEVKNFGD
jgi:DNA invertase Pin-like site-specific DNA recombinase